MFSTFPGSIKNWQCCFLSDYYVESELRCFSYHEGQGDAFNYIVVDDCESIETLDLIKESEINNIVLINPVLNNTIQIKNIYPNKLKIEYILLIFIKNNKRR